MDVAEQHPSCNYCEPFVFIQDPFAAHRPTWESKSIKCYNREHPVECHEGCGHLETCAIPVCGSYYNHGAAETAGCLGCPPGSFPVRLVDSAIIPVGKKAALQSEPPCKRVRYHALPVMRPFCKCPEPDAMWPIDQAMDCHFRNCGKGTAWRYYSQLDGVQRDNEIFTDCVTKRVREICPAEDPPTDCFLRPIYENSMFCMPPCTAGAGYGPCEESFIIKSHHLRPDGQCAVTQKYTS